MIDLKAARVDPDGFRAALARKGAAEAFDELLAADARWRELVPQVDELRGRQKIQGKPTPEQVEELKQVKEELRRLEEELAAAEAARDAALAQVPNPPHESVPNGRTEDDAEEVRRVGEPPDLADPREHTELGRFELERAAKLSGTRFGIWVGGAAQLALAFYRLALDRLVAKGFVPVLPPVLVREEAMYGTGWFPTEASNIYEVAGDELYLVGTAEVPLGGMHIGEILEEELPLRYAGFSTCFRREAGAAGKDTRGMFRVHQFNKVEQFVFTRAEESWDEHERLLANTEGIVQEVGLPYRVHQFNKVEQFVFTRAEESWDEHEQLLANTEEIVQEVGLPYRVVVLPAGDMSAASAKTYDVEVWFPSQGRYRETASISNTTDYQGRRLQIRYRGERGPEVVHTLNGTAAVDRMVLALLEVNQREDGSVEVPEALRVFGAPAEITPGS